MKRDSALLCALSQLRASERPTLKGFCVSISWPFLHVSKLKLLPGSLLIYQLQTPSTGFLLREMRLQPPTPFFLPHPNSYITYFIAPLFNCVTLNNIFKHLILVTSA